MDVVLQHALRGAIIGGAVFMFMYLLLQSAKQPALRDPQTGDLILRFNKILPSIMGVIAFGAPIGLVILSMVIGFKNPSEKYIPIVMGVMFLALGGGPLPYLLKARIRVSGEELEYTGPFGGARKIAWCNVVRVRFHSDGSLSIVSSTKQKIKVQPFMVGIKEFAGLLDAYLPQAARDISIRDLEKFDRFLKR